jgi:prepilin-type N-terminal cleavage/methylation domain-containing protein
MKMKVKVKENNRGFSLVELIVVIAIMGILAVTLAPRLSQYVAKARVESDHEVTNTIFTAAKLAYMQYPDAFQAAEILHTGADDNDLQLRVMGTPDIATATKDATDTLYTSSDGVTWAIDDAFETSNKFIAELQSVLGNFKLKSEEAGTQTQIVISLDTNSRVQVTLDYDGDAAVEAADGDYRIFE